MAELKVSSMIEDHLKQLRSLVEQASGLPEDTKAQLLQLVSTVEGEAARGELNDDLEPATDENATPERQRGLGRLIAAVDGLEAAHPELTDLINRIAMTLSKMGF